MQDLQYLSCIGVVRLPLTSTIIVTILFLPLIFWLLHNHHQVLLGGTIYIFYCKYIYASDILIVKTSSKSQNIQKYAFLTSLESFFSLICWNCHPNFTYFLSYDKLHIWDHHCPNSLCSRITNLSFLSVFPHGKKCSDLILGRRLKYESENVGKQAFHLRGK